MRFSCHHDVQIKRHFMAWHAIFDIYISLITCLQCSRSRTSRISPPLYVMRKIKLIDEGERMKGIGLVVGFLNLDHKKMFFPYPN